MGKVESIDVSLSGIWRAWYRFRQGKKPSREIDRFSYSLETQLYKLYADIASLTYTHSPYQCFTVTDNKRRDIAVAGIRDRVIHRLLYDYLVPIYDKTFIYDAWSCREGKGLVAAINRAQEFLKKYPNHYVWRSDITKFFDSVNQDVLFTILRRRIKDETALYLMGEVMKSYSMPNKPRTGIPIGNLTSQICSNIYLNEFDRYIKHALKPFAYMRYGDDFLIITKDKSLLEEQRLNVIKFLTEELSLRINPKNDIIIQPKDGVYFLGVELYPSGRRLKKRNWHRAKTRINSRNLGSYYGLVSQHCNEKYRKQYDWVILNTLKE